VVQKQARLGGRRVLKRQVRGQGGRAGGWVEGAGETGRVCNDAEGRQDPLTASTTARQATERLKVVHIPAQP
jgi:hypothetical protein